MSDGGGIACIRVDDGPVPFAYTLGLMDMLGHPELVICGLPGEGHLVLYAMVEDIVGGRSFGGAWPYAGVLETGRIATRAVHGSQHARALPIAVAARGADIGGADVAALQVFWPDRAGKFPFDPDCDAEVHELQPRLDLPFDRAAIGSGGRRRETDSPVRARRAAPPDRPSGDSRGRRVLAGLLDRLIAAKLLQLRVGGWLIGLALAGLGIALMVAPAVEDRVVRLTIGGFFVLVGAYLWVQLRRMGRRLC